VSLDDDVRTTLRADAGVGGVKTLLTGDIYTWAITGRMFIARDNTATSSAFDSNGIIKPCCMVKLRSENPFDDITDDEPLRSTRSVLELWFYQDDGYDTIESAKQRAFTLLHKQCVGGFKLDYTGDPMLRTYTDEFGGAFMLRSEYQAFRVNTGQ